MIATIRDDRRDTTPIAPIAPVAVAESEVISDPDAQLALWILNELHYRGFEGVPDREWDPGLIALRRTLESRFEADLRAAVRSRLDALGERRDVAAQLLALVDADEAPALAAFLHRHATLDQVVDFLRERSVQQLKEADPQSFVLPRLTGPAKTALAELQYDEYGGGRPERLHQTLFAQSLEAAGLDATYGAYIDEVSAISLANANAMSLLALNRRLRGAAMGHFAVFEATSSAPSRRIAIGIERVGLPTEVGAYFDEHVEADAVHEHVALRDICGSLVESSPELYDDVLFGGAVCLHLSALSGEELLARWAAPLEEAS